MTLNVFGGMTLKALLENPDLQHAPAALSGAPNSKAKKAENGSAEVDFTSAFLGPQLWNKTFNTGSFNLEYMDLDEFLGENMTEIPMVENPALNNLITSPSSSPLRHSMLQRGNSPRSSPPHIVSPPLVSSHSSPPPPHVVTPQLHVSSRGSPPHIVTPQLHVSTYGSRSHIVTPPVHVSSHSSPPPPHIVTPPLHVSPPRSPCSASLQLSGMQSHRMVAPPDNVMSPSHFLLHPKAERPEEAVQRQKPAVTVEAVARSPGTASAGSTPPASPVPLQVEFSLTEQDLALSSVPGQSIFDPTCQTFTEDELKPQPMIKKSRKVFVPDDLKDDRYWARRKKNNYAAKRSRDARRVKENQIAMRAGYLEKENDSLRDEMEKVRRENARLKHRLSKYESTE